MWAENFLRLVTRDPDSDLALTFPELASLRFEALASVTKGTIPFLSKKPENIIQHGLHRVLQTSFALWSDVRRAGALRRWSRY